jgi:hypothetical protein
MGAPHDCAGHCSGGRKAYLGPAQKELTTLLEGVGKPINYKPGSRVEVEAVIRVLGSHPYDL